MNSTTNEIISVFEKYRMTPAANDQYDLIGKKVLTEKVDSFVSKNETVNFVMLGFPFKSTNRRDKVLGELPDLGEQLTIENFMGFNNEIKKVYSPGVNISIASDGYAFNNILGVTEREVERYLDISSDMARYAPIRWYTLNNFYSHGTNTNRERLFSHFGITELELERLILTDDDVNTLYKGMIRFMFEELSDKEYPNNSQLQKAAKKLARAMMLANEAYSNLIKKEFVDHIRISMHQSVNNGSKFSFKLIQGENVRHSAWHCVIVETPTGHQTMHKRDAIAAGYELVHKK
jgi:pyoverdine/dityrosine biosynthesis protein Dit1